MSDQSPQPKDLDGDTVVARCKSLGFALAGVTRARRTEFPGELNEWIDRGAHGTMAWLAQHADIRAEPERFVEGARSIVMVADIYSDGAPDEPAPGRGRVARYARGDDYHAVMKKRLHALCDELREAHPARTFRAFVDTAPVLEREHAARAGIGFIGKHTLAISPALGSYFFLGGIVTDASITQARETDRWDPVANTPDTGHCGTCTRCIDACPTDAITPWSVDASKCISYLTIEHREPIDERFWGAIGDNLYGCDICQDVCPHNRESHSAALNEVYAPRHAGFDLLDVLGWTEDDRRAACARSAMKRAKLPMFKRNAVICAVNAIEDDAPNASDMRALIERLASDESEDMLARDAAQTALRILDR